MSIVHWVSGLESNNFIPVIFFEILFDLFRGPSEIFEVIMFTFSQNFNFTTNIVFLDVSVNIDDFTVVFISSIY